MTSFSHDRLQILRVDRSLESGTKNLILIFITLVIMTKLGNTQKDLIYSILLLQMIQSMLVWMYESWIYSRKCQRVQYLSQWQLLNSKFQIKFLSSLQQLHSIILGFWITIMRKSLSGAIIISFFWERTLRKLSLSSGSRVEIMSDAFSVNDEISAPCCFDCSSVNVLCSIDPFESEWEECFYGLNLNWVWSFLTFFRHDDDAFYSLVWLYSL